MAPESLTEPFLKSTADPITPVTLPNIKFPNNVFAKAANLRQLRLWSHLITVTLTSFIWILALIIVWTTQSSCRQPSIHIKNAKAYGKFVATSSYLTCGKTTAEAKKLGCHYDILSNHWVPAKCMDEEAVEEYQSDGSWHGFSDERRTKLLSIEEMSDMDFYYTSERDHIVHCAMLWRKQFRAFAEERVALDTIIADKDHTEHCSQFLMDMTEKGPDYRNMPIKTFVGYAGCWIKEGQ
ncbi:hypothetical protein LZ30DRAFT_743489 [Colletotrichum cereale]|nr:hypothetical protein LZ30DRAFT_743489 [Colletotrichum cereale]